MAAVLGTSTTANKQPGSEIVSRARPTQWSLNDTKQWRLQKLEVLFDNAKLSDIKIRPNIIIPKESDDDDGREFYYAQKAYLASWSPVFDSIFFGQGVGGAGVGAVEDGELTLECLKDILWLFLKYFFDFLRFFLRLRRQHSDEDDRWWSRRRSRVLFAH